MLFAFPRAFRGHLGAFGLALGITLLGCLFGWFVIRQDPEAKAVLMPFAGLMQSPAERVAREESAQPDRLQGKKGRFSAELMTHNIQVTVLALAAGMTWGFGTLVLLFYNGVILGAVATDYILGGQGLFLAGALIGWGGRANRSERLRAVAHDLFAIVAGAAGLLVWAGLVEAFISQYHQPVLPYALKIGLGLCELTALVAFLGWAGRE
jgi:uncharacterized membrane protein SpoIIM required for sporulation